MQKALSLFEKGPLSAEVRSWRLRRHTTFTPAELARWINPIVRGWMSYYGGSTTQRHIRCWAASTIT
ncbi:MAG: group II intron maturase-specific domain-containing protein [Streptosporangiaceae bacterium]